MKNFIRNYLEPLALVLVIILIGGALAFPLYNLVYDKYIVEKGFGTGGYEAGPITIVGTAPTSPNFIINTSNTESINTTTATTTNYVMFGPEIDQVHLNLFVYSTSTDVTNNVNGVGWNYGFSSRNATQTTFFDEDSASMSSSLVTHAVATTTHLLQARVNGNTAKSILVCSNNYDGTDDIPLCYAGQYKFEIYRYNKFGNFGLYAEVVGVDND